MYLRIEPVGLPFNHHLSSLPPASSPAAHTRLVSWFARLLLILLPCRFLGLRLTLSIPIHLLVCLGFLLCSFSTRLHFLALFILDQSTILVFLVVILLLPLVIATTTTRFLLDVQLRCFLDNIVPRALDRNGRIGGFSVLLDLVAAL